MLRLCRFALTVALVFLYAHTFPLLAEEVSVRRDVLILYDSDDPFANTADTSQGHQNLGMPLNRLGLMDQYADVKQRPLPDTSKYAAIAIWFADSKMHAPEEFLAWLTDALKAGTRVVLFGSTGAEENTKGEAVVPEALAAFYDAMGMRLNDEIPSTTNPFAIREVVKRPDAFGFETDLPPARVYYVHWTPVDKSWTSWKSLERTDRQVGESVVIATGKRGGWIADEDLAVRMLEEPTFRVRWDLNPLQFLEAALDWKGMPRPDVTTVHGARAAFSHIDADGQLNMTQDLPGPSRPSSQVVLEEILEVFPVPVTVGLIVARTDPKALGDEKYLPLFKRIMARSNIQAGCHGYAHPLNWAKGVVGMEVPGYTFSEQKETVGAMEYLNQSILPEGEKVEIFLWTGDCAPRESAVAFVEDAGVFQMNGGDPRYDGFANSLTDIPPLTRPVGQRRQIHAAACNEYIYTNGWTENYSGFRNVLDTFRRTEAPRLLPVNIYYHFYSGEKQAGLSALKEVYDWAVAQPHCWIHAAEYARSVQGFMSMALAKTADGGWRYARATGLQTIRFDESEAHVDMAQSTGVLGYTHHAGSLYVSLSAAEGVVYLSDTPSPAVSVRMSTSLLRNVKQTTDSWSAEARLYAPGELQLQGLTPNKKLRMRVGERSIEGQSDASGRVILPLPKGWGEWIEVHLGY